MFQTGKNVDVRYLVEGTFGTKPAAGGASKIFRTAPSSGLELKKTSVRPKEFRSDGMMVMSRHGSKSVEGSYEGDLSVGTFDTLLEACLRGTYLASFAITQATMTSITTQAGPPSTITAAGGSWITQGVKIGDVVVLTGHSTAANNSKNLRVTAVTALVLTVAETLVTDAVADASFTVTVAKRLIQGNPPVSRSFTFEEYFQDIDKSQVFKGCRLAGLTLKFEPDSTVGITFKLIGQDEEILEGAAAPYFTAPTISTSIPLVVVDGKVRVNNVDVIEFTNFEITVELGGATQPVMGQVTSPDVFINNAQVTASLSALREDFDNVNFFINETQFDIAILCVEPMAEPKNHINFYFGAVKAMGNSKSIGNDNALIETIPVDVGKDEAGGAHAATMMMVSTSAP